MEAKEQMFLPLVRTIIVKEKRIPYVYETIDEPRKVVDMVRGLIKGADREYVIVISVDTKSKPVGIEVVSIGSLNAAIIQPREIYKRSILENSAGVVMIHTHPSGDPEPSKEDILITKKMKMAGKILGIELLDHIIVGDDAYVSLAESGELEVV